MAVLKTNLLAMGAVTLCMAQGAFAQPGCQGGAYLNPQLFRGDAAHHSAIAEQELHGFIAGTGLPVAPLYAIKRIDDVTSSGRAPYCWIYGNSVVGLLSGYKPVVINTEMVRPAVLAITSTAKAGSRSAISLASLSVGEQKATLDQMTRSMCVGTAGGVESAIVKAEGLCARVEDVAPQTALGQQGLIARAAYSWEEQAWVGLATREAWAMAASLKGLAGKSEKVHDARLVVVPTRGSSFGFGLYVHPSVDTGVVKKASAAFQSLTAPSKPLAVALDLGPQFSFVVPTQQQVEATASAIGLRK